MTAHASDAIAKTHVLTTNVQSTANVQLMSPTRKARQFSSRFAENSKSPANARVSNSDRHHVKMSAATTPIVEATINAAPPDAPTCAHRQWTKGFDQLHGLLIIQQKGLRPWMMFRKTTCDQLQGKAVWLRCDASQQDSHHRRLHGNVVALK